MEPLSDLVDCFRADSLFVLPFLHGVKFQFFIQNLNFLVSCVCDLQTLLPSSLNVWRFSFSLPAPGPLFQLSYWEQINL